MSRNNCGRFCENAERGSTMSQPTSCAFCFKSPCTCDRNPIIDVPFFSLLLSLGISVNGLALALFRSKMMSDGFSSPLCFELFGQFLFALYKLDFDVEFARGFLNFRLEEEVVYEGENPRIGVLALRQRLRLSRNVGRGKARPAASTLALSPPCGAR